MPELVQGNTQELPPEWVKLTQKAPAAAVIPLLLALQYKKPGPALLNIKAPIWTSQFEV